MIEAVDDLIQTSEQYHDDLENSSHSSHQKHQMVDTEWKSLEYSQPRDVRDVDFVQTEVHSVQSFCSESVQEMRAFQGQISSVQQY